MGMETNEEKRTWNTPLREPWNPIIKQCLIAIDLHTDFYLKDREPIHLRQADLLRKYVTELKNWIVTQECPNGVSGTGATNT